MAKTMTVTFREDKKYTEYYNVPEKVAKAIQTLLNEAGCDESEIMSAEGEDWE